MCVATVPQDRRDSHCCSGQGTAEPEQPSCALAACPPGPETQDREGVRDRSGAQRWGDGGALCQLSRPTISYELLPTPIGSLSPALCAVAIAATPLLCARCCHTVWQHTHFQRTF